MKRKILIGIAVVVVALVAVLGFLMYQSSTPLDKTSAQQHLEGYFDKLATKAGKNGYSGVQALVVSSGKAFEFQYAGGMGARVKQLSPETPFHIASVGKLMTATMIYQLADAGALDLDKPIGPLLLASNSLTKEALTKLFTFEGVDYSDRVTAAQLLAHTSGVADYFDGPVTSGEPLLKLMLQSPERMWTPAELVAISSERQIPVNAPGQGYHYSDTGYVLLGLLVEALTDKSFEDNLVERIFEPTQMTHTYMALRQKPLSGYQPAIGDVWLKGSEIGGTNALSVDWAGGGLISMLSDLKSFSQALHGGKLISQESYTQMFSDQQEFQNGIHTGAGGMTVHFEKFFPLLKLQTVNGHIGVLSTHVFYDAVTDSHIVLNFGSTDQMVTSFTTLIEIINTLNRIQ